MSSIPLSGVTVRFPFEKPYGSQKVVMAKIIQALKKRENALLESPTGTGKSMAILCAALAWQNSLLDEERQKSTIFICSRTHTQITQLVKELKNTSYTPRMTILAARKHNMCVHAHVKKDLKNINETCRDMLKTHACNHYNGVQRTVESILKGPKRVMDIEDILQKAAPSACPYFTARELAKTAEVVFCPYNYIIDAQIRESLGIKLKDAVVIIDEAHNLESTCQEAASCSFGMPMIIELEKDLKKAKNLGEKLRHHAKVYELLKTIRAWMKKHEKLSSADLESKKFCWPHPQQRPQISELEAFLKQFDITYETWKEMDKSMEEVINFANKDQKDSKGLLVSQGSITSISQANAKTLGNLRTVLGYMMGSKDALKDYRAVLNREFFAGDRILTLHFWCLSASVAFSQISKKTRSCLLLSGTLRPLKAMSAELNASFAQQFEANHVIDKDQAFVCSVSKNLDTKSLRANYKGLQDRAFVENIGHSLLKLMKEIPGGILFFTTSYAVLDKLVNNWKACGLWKRMKMVKEMFQEPRGGDKSKFNKIMDNFYKSVGSTKTVSRTANKGKRLGMKPRKKKTIACFASKKGGVFMGVCRGKISEGVDFTDNECRAVIMCGIPYPAFKSLRVTLKKEYNSDEKRRMQVQKEGLNLIRSNNLLSGEDWYTNEAFRALNQAIGRCIRHRCDFGAIIFLDDRFQKNSHNLKKLSKWVARSPQFFTDAKALAPELRKFFQKMEKDPPKNRVRQTRTSVTKSTRSKKTMKTISTSIDTKQIKIDQLGAFTHKNQEKPNVATGKVSVPKRSESFSALKKGLEQTEKKRDVTLCAKVFEAPSSKTKHALAEIHSPLNDSMASITEVLDFDSSIVSTGSNSEIKKEFNSSISSTGSNPETKKRKHPVFSPKDSTESNKTEKKAKILCPPKFKKFKPLKISGNSKGSLPKVKRKRTSLTNRFTKVSKALQPRKKRKLSSSTEDSSPQKSQIEDSQGSVPDLHLSKADEQVNLLEAVEKPEPDQKLKLEPKANPKKTAKRFSSSRNKFQRKPGLSTFRSKSMKKTQADEGSIHEQESVETDLPQTLPPSSTETTSMFKAETSQSTKRTSTEANLSTKNIPAKRPKKTSTLHSSSSTTPNMFKAETSESTKRTSSETDLSTKNVPTKRHKPNPPSRFSFGKAKGKNSDHSSVPKSSMISTTSKLGAPINNALETKTQQISSTGKTSSKPTFGSRPHKKMSLPTPVSHFKESNEAEEKVRKSSLPTPNVSAQVQIVQIASSKAFVVPSSKSKPQNPIHMSVPTPTSTFVGKKRFRQENFNDTQGHLDTNKGRRSTIDPISSHLWDPIESGGMPSLQKM